MGLQIAYLYLTLTNSKGQGQCYTYFDSEYVGNGDYENMTIAIK